MTYSTLIIDRMVDVTVTSAERAVMPSGVTVQRSKLKSQSKKQAKAAHSLAKMKPSVDGLCQNPKCKNHGIPDFRGLQKHHLKFRSKGRDDSPENIAFLCGKCHSAAHGILEK